MLANSATAPPAMTSFPTSECRVWVSRSTGTMMPTDVEQSATATSRGVNATPAACSANAPPAARAKEMTKLATPGGAACRGAREVELDAGEEEQERDPEQSEKARDLVDVQQAEHLRPDEDAGDDLQHDRRHPQPREEAEDERHAEGEHRDAEQVEQVLLRDPPPSGDPGRRAWSLSLALSVDLRITRFR